MNPQFKNIDSEMCVLCIYVEDSLPVCKLAYTLYTATPSSPLLPDAPGLHTMTKILFEMNTASLAPRRSFLSTGNKAVTQDVDLFYLKTEILTGNQLNPQLKILTGQTLPPLSGSYM